MNPIRAAIAETIEESEFTSAQKRAAGIHRECSVRIVQCSENANEDSAGHVVGSLLLPDQMLSAAEEAPSAERRVYGTGGSVRHLAPVELKERDGEAGPCVHKAGARCSNKGFLPMSTSEYLQLLDWTARQVRSDKRGATPQEFAPLFERLGVSAEIWCRLVKDFGKLFSVVAGQPQRIDRHSSKATRSAHRFRIRRAARELMASASAAGC